MSPRLRIVVSLEAARSRLARFVTGSMALHALLVSSFVIIPGSRHKAAPIEDTMVVALAGPIGSAPPAPSGGSPPQPAKPEPPAPAPPPKEAHAVREVPVVKPKEKPKKEKPKQESGKPVEKPAPPAPPAGAKPPGSGSGPADRGDAHPGATGSGVTASIGGGDSSLGWYGAAVKAALEAVWIKPYLEDAQGVASVVVAFDIARDGSTRNLRIVQPSGIPSLDRSAQRAVIEASPLPAVPPQWTDDTIPVTMRFELSPDSR